MPEKLRAADGRLQAIMPPSNNGIARPSMPVPPKLFQSWNEDPDNVHRTAALVFLAAPSCSSYITGEVLPIIGGYAGG